MPSRPQSRDVAGVAVAEQMFVGAAVAEVALVGVVVHAAHHVDEAVIDGVPSGAPCGRA